MKFNFITGVSQYTNTFTFNKGFEIGFHIDHTAIRRS